MNQKGFANIVLIILVVVLAGAAGYFALNNRSGAPTPAIDKQPSPSPTPTPFPKPSPTPTQSPSPTPISDATKCTNYSVVKLNDNQSFIYTYNNDSELRAIPEKKFEGILKEYTKLPPGISTTLQRDLTYNLDGKAIYTTEDDLSKYVGKRVILTGKNYKFELEGTQRDEIWPVSIVCK